ncbi:MAG: hypothetical protein ACTSWX_00205 [Promethearchaeota archaeon]
METNLILLIISTSLKSIVIFSLGTILINKWFHQKQRYYSDFPFLNSLGFYFYAIGKIFDIYLYIRFRSNNTSGIINDSVALVFAKTRFLLSPVIVLIPYVILMLVIWFEGKKKIQIGIGTVWALISVLAVLFARSYPQLLIINALIAFPPIFLSIITFGIINHQKRLPQINSFILMIGWSLYVGSQLIRSIWVKLGSGTWGLSYVGELVEMLTFIIIGIGFMIPAFYSKEKQSIINKTNHINEIEDQIEKFNYIPM